MTVRLEEGMIRLEGDCHIEDAEALVSLLQGGAARPVDVSRSGHLHSAVMQALLSLTPRIVGSPGDRFIREWVLRGAPPDEAEHDKEEEAGSMDMRMGRPRAGSSGE